VKPRRRLNPPAKPFKSTALDDATPPTKTQSGENTMSCTATPPTDAQVDQYFRDLRHEYVDGKLSKRQIAAIEERLPGFLTHEGIKPTRKPTAMSDKQCEDWMTETRTLYSAGKLPAWQIARIEQIPGWTWTQA
jgi:hypothetical protein